MRKQIRISILTALLALGGVRLAAAVESPKSFLSGAIEDSRSDIQLSQLALQKSQNADVKSFAQRMIKDHTALNERIEALARAKNLKLPGGTSLRQQASYEQLSHASGNFDKLYMDDRVAEHQYDIKKFSEQAQSATDPEVKALAAEMVPKMQEDLRLAQTLDAKLKH